VGLLCAQHGDRSRELLADHFQTRKADQAAYVAAAVLV
jgi:hypothetical protein